LYELLFFREKPEVSDLVYIKEDAITTLEDGVLACMDKEQKRKSKDRDRDFMCCIQDSVDAFLHNDIRRSKWRVRMQGQHSKISLLASLPSQPKQKKRRVTKKERKAQKFVLSVEEFPPLNSHSVAAANSNLLDWRKLKFDPIYYNFEISTKTPAMEVESSKTTLDELNTELIDEEKQPEEKQKKTRKRRKPSSVPDMIKKIWKIPRQDANCNFISEALTDNFKSDLINTKSKLNQFVIFTKPEVKLSSFTRMDSKHSCIIGKELKRKRRTKVDYCRREVVKPLLVKIKTASVKPSLLHSIYASSYCEAQSTPRCFKLNIEESTIVFQRVTDQSACLGKENQEPLEFDLYL
jgi:hypothetical protein